ncbi:PD40 domain-containing protein [Deinococcus radiotolerans]|nr:PD40 domain-containing protein [Deinococcus radiotolerans]
MPTVPLRAGLALALTVLLNPPGAAAATVTVRDGDLYLNTPQRAIRLTTYGRNSDPVVSPDGQWVLYLSLPQWVVGGGYLPTNVWVMNLRTRVAHRLADQPAPSTPEGPYICRDLLVWSSDSRSAAWVEWRVTSTRNYTRPSPTFVVTQSVDGDRRQEVRVHSASATLGWRDEDLFIQLWSSVTPDRRWVNNDLMMSLRPQASAAGDRVRLNVQTGALTVVSR